MEENNEQKNSENDSSKYIKWIFYGIVFIAIIIFKAGAKKEIGERAIEEAIQNVKAKTSVSEEQQVWFTNTRYGLFFETPKPMKEMEATIPKGTEDGYSAVYSYIFNDDDIVVNHFIMDTYFKEYDTEKGLEGMIKNAANIMGSYNLSLDFEKWSDKYIAHTCRGSLFFEGDKISVRGFSLFKEGRVNIIICFGDNTKVVSNKMDRIFNSITVGL